MSSPTPGSLAPMRASDQDRQEAALALADAFADGRLDHEEFEDRHSRALQATYLHDLDPLFADLPGRVAPASRPVPQVAPPARRPGPRGARIVFPLAAVALVVALAITTGAHALWLLLPLVWFASAARRRHHWHAVHAQAARSLPNGPPRRW